MRHSAISYPMCKDMRFIIADVLYYRKYEDYGDKRAYSSQEQTRATLMGEFNGILEIRLPFPFKEQRVNSNVRQDIDGPGQS